MDRRNFVAMLAGTLPLGAWRLATGQPLTTHSWRAQDADLETSCDSLMPNANRTDMPASVLIIAKDGKPLLRKGYGMANIEMSVPASPDHLFTLASVMKQMVAVCVLQLTQQGKLHLTDDIRNFFPGANTHGKLITVEQLLTHTSGIYSANSPARGDHSYDHNSESGMLSDHEFVDYAMQHPLDFEPGADWSWNTFAYHLAFLVVEKASGVPFNEYVRKCLFQPAGMEKSFSKVDGNRLGLFGIKNLNTSFYFLDADKKWIWRDARVLTPYFLYQRYSIVTCLDDLVKWDVALRKGQLLSAESLQKAWTTGHLKDGRNTNYGLGWMLGEQDGYKLISSSGIGTNPIATVHVPQEGLYIAYTQWYGTIDQAENKVKKILSRLLPISYPTPEKSNLPLSDYAGVYHVHRNGPDIASQVSDIPLYISITASNGTLYFQQTAGEKIELRPAGKDRFLSPYSENTYYVFLRDDSGKVNAISTRGTFWAYGPDVANKRVNKTWPQPVTPKAISAALLNKYAGIYYMQAFDSYVVIETDGARLYVNVQGNRLELLPVADNKFVRKGIEDIQYEFVNGTTETTGLVVSGLRKVKYKKEY